RLVQAVLLLRLRVDRTKRSSAACRRVQPPSLAGRTRASQSESDALQFRQAGRRSPAPDGRGRPSRLYLLTFLADVPLNLGPSACWWWGKLILPRKPGPGLNR